MSACKNNHVVLRILCGSQQATCSRVGVPNMADELTVASSRNVRHLAETWFTYRKHLIYRIHRLENSDPFTGRAAAAADDDDDEGSSRSTVIPPQTKCRHVDWYLSNVAATVMFSPSTSNPLHFGILRVS